jgi:hypothetical protein
MDGVLNYPMYGHLPTCSEYTNWPATINCCTHSSPPAAASAICIT